jgi:tRNA (adenine57-N1/adenine58-N1)-methyltransferase
MSMPRGAAVVYPKDAGQIVQMADIFPGATVVEAGVGSGACRCRCCAPWARPGGCIRFERRADFAEIARPTRARSSACAHPAWTVTVGDLVESMPAAVEPATVDRVVLDMLAPWECLDVVADALTPGGVLICYVATATQLSRVAETDARAWRLHRARRRGSRWSAAGTSRAWRCGPSTGCTGIPAS